jgi:hypothetical protein
MAEPRLQLDLQRLETGLESLSVHRLRRTASPPRSASGPLVVCFSSAGNPVRRSRVEFGDLVASTGRPALFICDLETKFFSAPGLADRIAEMVRAEMLRTRSERAVTLGFSRGGFGAIAFAERFPVQLAIALAPRWSPDPDIVPDPRTTDTQWPLPFSTLAAGLAAVPQAFVLHGMIGPDRRQLRHFPRRPGLEHWLLPHADHVVSTELRRLGLFAPVVQAALSEDISRAGALLRAAGALRAQSVPARLRLALTSARLHRLFGALPPSDLTDLQTGAPQ